MPPALVLLTHRQFVLIGKFLLVKSVSHFSTYFTCDIVINLVLECIKTATVVSVFNTCLQKQMCIVSVSLRY